MGNTYNRILNKEKKNTGKVDIFASNLDRKNSTFAQIKRNK